MTSLHQPTGRQYQGEWPSDCLCAPIGRHRRGLVPCGNYWTTDKKREFSQPEQNQLSWASIAATKKTFRNSTQQKCRIPKQHRRFCEIMCTRRACKKSMIRSQAISMAFAVSKTAHQNDIYIYSYIPQESRVRSISSAGNVCQCMFRPGKSSTTAQCHQFPAVSRPNLSCPFG